MGVRWPADYANIVYHFSMDNIDGEATAGLGAFVDTATKDVAMCNAIFDSFIASGLFSHQATSVSFTKVTASVGPSHPGGPFLESTLSPIDGGEGGDQLIPNTTSLVRKYTALGGRAGRGRMYLPLVRDGDVDSGGAIDGGVIGDLQAALDTHVGDLVALNVIPFLFHDSATAPTVLTNLVIEPMVATQRGRLAR